MNKKIVILTSADIIDAAGNAARVRILDLLVAHGELPVNDIMNKCDCSQSLTSHHLMLLTKAGYIKKERKGKQIFYSINSIELYRIIEIARKHLRHNL